MDDTTQNQNPGNQSAVQPTTQVPQQTGRHMEPPSVSGNREHQPIATAATFEQVRDEEEVQTKEDSESIVIQSAQPEVVIPAEVETIVEKSPDTEKPELSQEVQKAGLTPAKAATPVSTTPSANIQLPMSYQQAVLTKKRSKFRDSIRWLASVIIYQWKKLNPNIYK